jgi:Helix-turn-helix domain
MATTQVELRPMLRLKEVAELLRCHPNVVMGLVKSGQLRSVRFAGEPGGRGGWHRFDPREIERFMAGGKSNDQPQ